MKKKDQILLEEAYMRVLLKEEEFPGDETQFTQAYQNAISGKYIPFVQWLKKYSDDKRIANIIKGGMQDGNQSDDQIAVTPGANIAVNQLWPTQKEIGIANSLAYPLDKPQEFAKIFTGAPVDTGSVIVLNGRFVLDGHHRWSQTFCYNPKAQLVVTNYQNDKFEQEGGLKAIQAAIVALKSPGTSLLTKPNNEPNLLNCSFDEVRKILNPTQEVLNQAIQIKFCTDLQTFQDRIIQNVQALRDHCKEAKWENNPPRGEMPQPGMNKVGDKDLENALKSGKIDVVSPYKQGQAPVAQQQPTR